MKTLPNPSNSRGLQNGRLLEGFAVTGMIQSEYPGNLNIESSWKTQVFEGLDFRILARVLCAWHYSWTYKPLAGEATKRTYYLFLSQVTGHYSFNYFNLAKILRLLNQPKLCKKAKDYSLKSAAFGVCSKIGEKLKTSQWTAISTIFHLRFF